MSNLYQRSILITRPQEKAKAMADLVQKWNGRPVLLPTITIDAPEDWMDVDEAIGTIAEYDWIVFSSAHGVEYFCRRFHQLVDDLKSCWTVNVAVVGQKTAVTLRQHHLTVDLIPEDFTADNLVEAFQSVPIQNKSVLYVTGNKGRHTIDEGLVKQGAKVDRIVAYRNVAPDASQLGAVLEQIQNGQIDFYTFTSPSTYQNFLEILDEQGLEPKSVMHEAVIAVIGRVTKSAVKENSCKAIITASESTIEGILTAIGRYIEQNGTVKDTGVTKN